MLIPEQSTFFPISSLIIHANAQCITHHVLYQIWRSSR
jgi:hypothetical protein